MAQKITLSSKFIKDTKRLDNTLREKLKKQVKKIVENPEVGKPLKYLRGERTVYVKPFRIVYSYLKNVNEIVFLKFEHRKGIYNK
tara:strand:+ start:8585 stop:8839 length:255 start_codon:yes stop_codon:yes gene_type:complete